MPYRTHEKEPTFQSLRDPEYSDIPGGRTFPTALDPFMCNRYEIAEFAREAHALGMNHTIYTDPSGYDPRTISTAADQLRVFQRAMRFPVFRQIVSMDSVTLPVAGTLTNFNPLVT